MAKAKVEKIVLQNIIPRMMEVTIVGDSDLYLNKMNDVTMRQLMDTQKNKAKSVEPPNEWEIIITSMHWYNGKPTDFSKEGLEKALKENAPCISNFGLKQSFGQTVVRCGVDKYSTTFNANVNIKSHGDLTPIKFAEHCIDEKLIQAKRGAPVLARLNRFSGWSATFTISYMENMFSAEQIVNIINLAGFGIGIGSGRTSGFGRYHVGNVTPIA